MTRRYRLAILTIPFLITILHAGEAIIGSRVPDFVIEDQYERAWSSTKFKGGVTVYVLSDRSGYEYSTNWTNILVPRFQKSRARFVPVADVQEVPGFLKGLIRSRFRDEFKYAVLMDWDGVLTSAFKMRKGYTNLVVADRDGVIKLFAYGKGTKEQVEAFAAKLEEILAQS